MKKKNIIPILIVVFSINTLSANVNETIENLISYAINNNSNYLIAGSALDKALDDLDEDPLYYGSSISVEGNYSQDSLSTPIGSKLSVEIPLLEQLTLDANIDTKLDGNLGFTFNPLVKAVSNVQNEVNYENTNAYLNEYRDSLSLEIAKAYINYLLAFKNVELQEQQVEHDRKVYEEERALYEFEKSTLIEVQEASLSYNESQNSILDLELSVYKAELDIYELIGINNKAELDIPISEIGDIVDSTIENESFLEEKDFSVMSDYDVVKALNSTITLEDSYDSLAWYEPTLNLNANVSLDGSISASVVFRTSYDDFNREEKEDLKNDIYLSKMESTSKISKVQNNIDLLERSIESDKQFIEDIQLQIGQNNLVLDEANSLLELDAYEVLDYETLEINADKLDLSLIRAYVSLYVDQLTLINYL